jgi:hypothetical protein
MKRWMLIAAAALLLAGVPSDLWANAGPPPPAQVTINYAPQAVKFVVVVDESVKEPCLHIPVHLLGKDGRRGDAGAPVPLFVVGLALTMAFVSGGLWLARRGRNTTALVIAVGLFGLGGGVLIADIPRPKPKPPVELTLPAGIQLPAKLTLQINANGENLTLSVPSTAVLKAVKPEPKPGEE